MPLQHLYLVGLTGGIACGKSTIVAMLHELGAHTLDADHTTHALQQPGTIVYAQIVTAFGEGILGPPDDQGQHPINRPALASIVFRDPARLRELEQIVHPAVRQRIWDWLHHLDAQAGQQMLPGNMPVAVLDAIKLLESGWKPACHAVWVVTCAPEQQVARLMQARGLSEADARQRIAAQPTQESRIAQADLVIDNSQTVAHTRQQVQQAWERIQQRAAAG